MSQGNNKEYIDKNIYPITGSKQELILSLIKEISELEDKKDKMKNDLNEDKFLENKAEIEKIKQSKLKLKKAIKLLTMNLLLDISNKENLIKKKKYSMKEISKKIKNYKNILSTSENLVFNSPIFKKYLMVNNYSQFLSDEQIDDILSKTQNISKNDNLIQKIEKEYLEKKEELKNSEKERDIILNKLNEIKENIKMLKEEKLTINKELVNYISLKETFESIIKTNLPSIISVKNTKINNNENINEEINLEKNVFINRERYSRNRIYNNINIFQEQNDNNEISYLNNNNDNSNYFNLDNKKIFEEMITLYKYEISNLDINKLSDEIGNDILDLINSRIYSKKDNTGKSIALEKNKSIKMLDKGNSQKINDRYSSFNQQTFSCDSPILKRTKSNILLSNNNIKGEYKKEFQINIKKKVKNLINDINANKISPKNLSEILSDIIINILNEKGYKLNKKNLLIYISLLLKKSFYEWQISSKIKLLNKDYKNIKKIKKKIYDKLQDQLTILNSKIESINNTIILQENKLKLLNNNNVGIKKNKFDKSEIVNINGNINLSLDEQNYIQLCRKANSFINEKNEIEKEIKMLENDKKLEKYQGELKIKNMSNDLNEINKQIISKEKEISDNKLKLEEEILKAIKAIDDKYALIKENIISYKIDCSNNNAQSEYNDLIDKINNALKNNYYKTLFNLEKFFIIPKKSETNASTENLFSIENTLRTNKSFNFKSCRRNTKNMKLFSYRNSYISPNNIDKNNLFFKANQTINYEKIGKSSDKNNQYQNKIKNNFINIFDSNTNLNNYFFQFQTPSNIINISKQNNNLEMNNIISKINNINKEINNITTASQLLSSSKKSSSKKTYFSSSHTNDINQSNVIYNLRYLSRAKKYDESINKTNNLNEFKLIQNNTINIYKNGIENYSLYNKHNNQINFGQNLQPNKHKAKSKTNFMTKTNKNLKSEYINLNIFTNKKIFCYFRIFNNNKMMKECNPLTENISVINLCHSPYYFIKSNMYIDKPNKKIKIFPSNQIEPIEITSDKIKNKKINSLIDQIIRIYNGYQTFKKTCNSGDIIDLYIKKLKKDKLFGNIKDEDIKKICNNKFFCFELLLYNEKIIELLFTSYEEFQVANENICALIQNKKDEYFHEMFNIKKFEYPK